MGHDRPDAFYRRRLPHFQPDHRPVYLTFVTHHRWVLPPECRQAVLDHCLREHGQRYWMHAAVVMPDHVHLLLTLQPLATGATAPLELVLKAIKGCSARSVNRLLGRTGPVWQAESFDRILRHDESLRQKAEYLAANPVRRGICGDPDDYPWLWREWTSP